MNPFQFLATILFLFVLLWIVSSATKLVLTFLVVAIILFIVLGMMFGGRR